jgi:5-aminolevulinate synthase
VQALDSVGTELGIKRTSEWANEGGFIGVGDGSEEEPPLWTDEQLGLEEVVQDLSTGQGAVGVLENVLEKARVEPAKPVAAAA